MSDMGDDKVKIGGNVKIVSAAASVFVW